MSDPQATNTVMVVYPAAFEYDSETALSNAFQQDLELEKTELLERAQQECFGTVQSLRSAGIDVFLVQDTQDSVKPDAVFINNWLSTHTEGSLVVYPMATKARRLERRKDVVSSLSKEFDYRSIIDLSSWEDEGLFLEGTGSLVLDRKNRIAYASESARTSVEAVERWCRLFDYEPVIFRSHDLSGFPIYHTNVVLSVGSRLALFVAESVDPKNRARVKDRLELAGHLVLELSLSQMKSFSANALELRGSADRPVLAMSETGLRALSTAQRSEINRNAQILVADVSTIEKVGGGSLRCMLCELFLPRTYEPS